MDSSVTKEAIANMVASAKDGDESAIYNMFKILRDEYLPGLLRRFSKRNKLFSEEDCESAFWLGVTKGMHNVDPYKGNPIHFTFKSGMWEIWRQMRRLIKNGLHGTCENGHSDSAVAKGVSDGKDANTILECKICGAGVMFATRLNYASDTIEQETGGNFVYISEEEGKISVELFTQNLIKKAKLSPRQTQIIEAIRECINDNVECSSFNIRKVLFEKGVECSNTALHMHKKKIVEKAVKNGISARDLETA